MTGQSVLIVEDEPLIAMMLEDLLDILGHKVAGTVDSVADAIGRIDRGDFDVAILDIHLRGGEACWPVADALIDAGRPFILSTGGMTGDPPAAHRAAPVLSKPFTIESIERALDAVAGR